MIQYVLPPALPFLSGCAFIKVGCSRTGDLRSNPQEQDCVLHRFAVPGSAVDHVPFSLGRRLDLGVGGEGIIGRRVSFLQGREVIGEGIIGWN